MIALSDFEIIRPPYETAQNATLEWLGRAHVKAESVLQGTEIDHPTMESFHIQIQAAIARVGCKASQIQKRGHVLPDFLHSDWDNMHLFQLSTIPTGLQLDHRSLIFDKIVTGIFEQFFLPSSPAPDDLIHVTCTGYLAPSGAQKLVSLRKWTDRTIVTHAYHMGCYGAIPALRIAQGFQFAGRTHGQIVHTELCSLHANPSLHAADQLVCQTLFADGFIKYRIGTQVDVPHFRLLAIHEQLIPDSQWAMSWNLSSWGFEMSLAKEIPSLITASLKDAFLQLCKKVGLSYEEMISNALFAIHPGGPKIIRMIQNHLGLQEGQIRHSTFILQNYGNMSSATLPHIWNAILQDDLIQPGSLVISFAFGPGLTFCGTVMEKCGS